MNSWVIALTLTLMWGTWLALLGWYLRRSFPDGELTVGAFGHEKTFRWGTYKKGREIS